MDRRLVVGPKFRAALNSVLAKANHRLPAVWKWILAPAAIARDRTRADLVTAIPLKKDPEAFPRILRNKGVHSEHHSDFRSAIGCTVVVRDVGVNRR